MTHFLLLMTDGYDWARKLMALTAQLYNIGTY
jgi:hypothetical protein